LCKFIPILFILHLIDYYFFTYLEDERREWIMVVVYKEKKFKKFKKLRKIVILIKYSVK